MKTLINPQHLWKYREFDRSETPAPSCFGMVQYSVAEVSEYLKTNVMEPVDLVIIDNERAIVLDGNHRLKASIMNGSKLIPVNVKHFTQDEASEVLSIHTLARFVALT